jgi:hypothetical protein
MIKCGYSAEGNQRDERQHHEGLRQVLTLGVRQPSDDLTEQSPVAKLTRMPPIENRDDANPEDQDRDNHAEGERVPPAEYRNRSGPESQGDGDDGGRKRMSFEHVCFQPRAAADGNSRTFAPGRPPGSRFGEMQGSTFNSFEAHQIVTTKPGDWDLSIVPLARAARENCPRGWLLVGEGRLAATQVLRRKSHRTERSQNQLRGAVQRPRRPHPK